MSQFAKQHEAKAPCNAVLQSPNATQRKSLLRPHAKGVNKEKPPALPAPRQTSRTNIGTHRGRGGDAKREITLTSHQKEECDVLLPRSQKGSGRGGPRACSRDPSGTSESRGLRARRTGQHGLGPHVVLFSGSQARASAVAGTGEAEVSETGGTSAPVQVTFQL